MRVALATLTLALLLEAPFAQAQRASTDDEIQRILGRAPKLSLTPAAPVTPAASETVPFPVYDIDSLCERMATSSVRDLRYDARADRSYRETETSSSTFEGPPERIAKAISNTCVEREQGPYNSSKRVWQQVPREEQAKCVSGASRSTPYPYTYLNACVTNALAIEAQRRPGTSRFRY